MTINMKHSKSTPKTNQGTVMIVLNSSPNSLACEEKVDRVCLSIKKLLWSIGTVLEEVISADATGHIREEYEHCLKHTISLALDDVDEFLDKHPVANDMAVKFLRDKVINLWDDVERLFHQE